MPWGRGLGIALLLVTSLGLAHLSAGGTGGAVGRTEGEALRSLAGTAGSILVLSAVFLGGLVLAFDISIRGTVGALREHYLANRPESKPAKEKRPAEAWTPRNQVVRSETSEPVLVPISGVASQPRPAPAPSAALESAVAALSEPVDDEPSATSRRKKAAVAEPVLTVVPGKPALGIEVPNKATSLVTLREIIQTPTFQNDQTLLSLAIGTDVSGNTVVGDLTRMPHLLIAGATGSGKSVCINALIAGMLFQATPEELKYILIDPKRVEFSMFQDMPHLLVPVVTESDHAVSALR